MPRKYDTSTGAQERRLADITKREQRLMLQIKYYRLPLKLCKSKAKWYTKKADPVKALYWEETGDYITRLIKNKRHDIKELNRKRRKIWNKLSPQQQIEIAQIPINFSHLNLVS